MHRSVVFAPVCSICTSLQYLHQSAVFAPVCSICTGLQYLHRSVVFAPVCSICTSLPGQCSGNISQVFTPVILLSLWDAKCDSEFRICHNYSTAQDRDFLSSTAKVFLHRVTGGCYVKWSHHHCNLRKHAWVCFVVLIQRSVLPG